MLTLGDIKDKVYFDFRKSQLRAMETERLGIIHVSDLIKPCLRNVMYGKFVPKTSNSEDVKSLFYGQAVHQVTWLNDDKKYNEMFLAYDYVRDEPVGPMIIWADENISICSKIDILLVSIITKFFDFSSSIISSSFIKFLDLEFCLDT